MDEMRLARQERLLWLGAAALVLLIFSTTFLAGLLAGLSGTAKHALVLVPALLAAMLAFSRAGARQRAMGLAVAIALLLVLAMSLLRIVTPAERSHLIEYAGVALLASEALRLRAARGRPLPYPAVMTFFAVLGIGALDELLQRFMPHRSFDWRDIGVDAVAALLGIGISRGVHWLHRRISQA